MCVILVFCYNLEAPNLKYRDPLGTGRKLNVYKTFRRRTGRLLNVLCTFNLRPVSTGNCWNKLFCQYKGLKESKTDLAFLLK